MDKWNVKDARHSYGSSSTSGVDAADYIDPKSPAVLQKQLEIAYTTLEQTYASWFSPEEFNAEKAEGLRVQGILKEMEKNHQQRDMASASRIKMLEIEQEIDKSAIKDLEERMQQANLMSASRIKMLEIEREIDQSMIDALKAKVDELESEMLQVTHPTLPPQQTQFAALDQSAQANQQYQQVTGIAIRSKSTKCETMETLRDDEETRGRKRSSAQIKHPELDTKVAEAGSKHSPKDIKRELVSDSPVEWDVPYHSDDSLESTTTDKANNAFYNLPAPTASSNSQLAAAPTFSRSNQKQPVTPTREHQNSLYPFSSSSSPTTPDSPSPAGGVALSHMSPGPETYMFLIEGNLLLGTKSTIASPDLVNVMSQFFADWQAKKAMTVWSGQYTSRDFVNQCVATRMTSKGEDDEICTGEELSNTACSRCWYNFSPCVMAWRDQTPLVLPLPVNKRPAGALPTEVRYWVRT